ncbi:MAG: CaiB/BaiF CoA transferase family protein [Hyphomicrobiaceae bacterium]
MGNSGPLAKVRVLDLSQGIAGPHCGLLFAEHGAEVVKIEPLGGDWMRQLGLRIDGQSAYSIYYNRGKKSLALDIAKPAGREIALALARRSDVVIQSARPGVMDKLGLGFAAVQAVAPGIVYVSISGFGTQGPKARHPGTDTVAQAHSGLMSVIRGRDGAPTKIDHPVVDAITGLYAFQSATMALLGRLMGAPAAARHIDVSLAQSAVAIQAPKILEWSARGGPGELLLNPPTGNFRTADGWIAIALIKEEQFPRLCNVLGRPDMPEDARFSSFERRMANLQALRQELDGEFAKRGTQDWARALGAADVLVSPVNSFGDWLDDPQTEATGGAPVLPVTSQASAALPTTPGEMPFTAASPRLGEHTRGVLAELGHDGAAIDALIADGVAADVTDI